ncbi:hypothetical protein ZIOFF_029846 [Zingiber officinale]|uniref:Retrotransposon gag domain-containing protein n=1 Tax=Zingiber officinale TaxID=94328 RepID=A0A8J5LB68_ZINOF|nr:hypothetical protein ZIOFF_029846 [Zingiber officinale]
MAPRYSKMEFPTYSGEGDLLSWVKMCKKFFTNQRTTEVDKVGLAAFHLVGEAQLWFDQIEQEEPEMIWKQFRDHCHICFGPPLSNNPLGELANLKQTGSVEDYQRQFQSLLARTSDLRPRQQVDLFTTGLVEDLRIDIELQKPGNLGITMNMARALEQKQCFYRGGCPLRTNWGGITSKFNPSSGGPPVAKAKAIGDNSKGTPPTSFFKRLSRAEMAEQRAKDLCFNCDESYSTGHKCKRLFWIEVPDDDSKGEEEGEMHPEISLHAISGGSTHNFVREGLVPDLKVEIQKEVLWRGHPLESKPGTAMIRNEEFMGNKLESLLEDYDDLFQEPASLPPPRNCDHRISITLLPGSAPMVARPYRYPQL